MSAQSVNILREYARASAEQRSAGSAWYPAAGRLVRGLADWSGQDPANVAAALAALSPRNPWLWNAQDCAVFSLAAGTIGAPIPSATTFGANRRTAWAFLTGSADWRGSALKVRAFVRAILGDPDSVVVDVWAVRVATAGDRSAVTSEADYRELAQAYQTAALELGLPARDLQAIVWLSAQARGLGSSRRGGIQRAKRGTLSIVAELLGLDYQLTLEF